MPYTASKRRQDDPERGTMFREMRRKKQQLTPEEAAALLESATSGVLSVAGDDGYPYGVPLSYVYAKNTLYFHSALQGHKIDAVRACDKACFTVIAGDDIIPESYTTAFRSVIAFGRVRIVEDENDRELAARLLGKRYAPHESEESLAAELSSGMPRMHVLAFHIEHITGKEAIELTRQRPSS